jgi:glyoxylate/hydroxypyruvate reductase
MSEVLELPAETAVIYRTLRNACLIELAIFQVDPLMAERMATWVVWAVINSHRQLEAYRMAQLEKRWPKLQLPDNGDVSVMVLGNGVMGAASAAAVQQLGTILLPILNFIHDPRLEKHAMCLVSMHAQLPGPQRQGHASIGTMLVGTLSSTKSQTYAGYNTFVWSRTARQPAPSGVAQTAGWQALQQRLPTVDILVCLLPLTADTAGLISKDFLAQMKAGATIINAARGAHVVEDDLLQSLDAGVHHTVRDMQ